MEKRINLVCVNSEPFGLTVPESLYLGIPNISSRCGGPEEILDAEYTYEVDDVDGCVRAIERVISDYDLHSNKAKNAYMRFASINTIEKRKEIVGSVISSTINNFSNCSRGANDKIDWSNFQFLKKDFLTSDDLLETVVEVAATNGFDELYGDVKDNHKLEIKSPGSATLTDLCRFNAIPFSYSQQISDFYEHGLGLAIELAANAFDSNKKLMLGYVLLALCEKQASTSHPVNVLFLGDGLGLDALKISAYGFNVDYLDVENSLISQCASVNFKKAAVNLGRNLPITICDKLIQKYDAIVCLEVVEHAPGPSDFLNIYIL